MEAKIKVFLVNWNFMRLLRLGMGIYVGIQAFMAQSWSFGLIALLFLSQAITNTGCCGASGCAMPSNKVEDKNQIKFEEITK